VLKGIQAVEDAHAAMDAHVDGIVVSNHGAFSRGPSEREGGCSPLLRHGRLKPTECITFLAGRRQVDGAIGSFSALEKITASSRVRRAQEKGEFTVLFDSGIRTGSDVIKAIAMGARGVLGEQRIILFSLEVSGYSCAGRLSWCAVGRPIMYGLALGGEEGVEQVLRGLLAEAEVTLGLIGYKGIDEIWGKREAVLEKAETSRRCTKL
jgi:isopentenyl diphosphate isomerase/L-lactate dehydrogenase-like FMN-dependent dehydrogenase